MSFLKKLFGGGGGDGQTSSDVVAEASHKGFDIVTTPISEGGQFRVCAIIRKEIGGEVKEHRLIRADVCGSAQEASDIALRKCAQVIDERGERIFES